MRGCLRYSRSPALAQTIRVIRGLIITLAVVGAANSAFATTGSSPEFKLDLRGLGPWQRHTAAASEALTYSSSWATNAASGAKAVVKVMPVLKTKPKYLVIDLSGGTNATSYGISYLDEVPGGSWSDEYKTSKLVLRHIPAGSFIMGGRATDYPGAVNTNLHMVTITRDFYMGVFEVTQRQWELVMGTRPSHFSNELCYVSRPVEGLRWVDIRGQSNGIRWPDDTTVDDKTFLCELRTKTYLKFDLPTEAQWEFACRAGTHTALNSGKDLSATDIAIEMEEVGRYRGNSGWEQYKYDFHLDCDFGTDIVGMYIANDFGLYDMHGNVAEWCLDVFAPLAQGDMNPVGPPFEGDDKRVYRGGSWSHRAWDNCISGHRGIGDVSQDRSVYFCTYRQGMPNVGFRLCLQGGDVPDLASATTLVNESGAGSQSWSPTRSGAYYLTHSTMNGTTNVQLASAWFEVPGCTLTLEPQGELTNGVNVAIGGIEEGWTVYYTTNGPAPTTNSTVYAGAFSLPASATVRAVAYNAQGVASEETSATFTLHDALSVVGAVARQRYPWNGMVDVDVELKGDPEAKYEVEVEARDLDGGTNLPVRTVSLGGGRGATALPPGFYRLTWNADADIPYDHEFPRVAVAVKATAQSVVAAYARSLTISTDGYAGSETLTNVPVLVRLSTNITGFAYSDFASPTNGDDLAFFDANENELPYEIDEWHTNGEALVWVKLPTLTKGTTFTCAYGSNSSMNGRAQDVTAAKHEVWREYAGVWHMNEDSGTAYDSTEHGLDALPSCGANELADVSQMVAYENGACGRARVNATQYVGMGGNYMIVPSYDGLSLGSCFLFSTWINAPPVVGYPRIVSRKAVNESDGWEIEIAKNSSTNGAIRGDAATTFNGVYADLSQAFVNLVFAYDGSTVSCFTNGTLSVSGNILPALDNGRSLSFGSNAVGSEYSLLGKYDEIRLRGGSLSADRIKADYDMIANRKFCTYGAVKKGVE